MRGVFYAATLVNFLVFALIQRVQALTRLPSSLRVHCRLDFNRTIEERIEWERLIVLE